MKFLMLKSVSQFAKAIACFILSLVFSFGVYKFAEKYLLDHVKVARAPASQSPQLNRDPGARATDASVHIKESERELACFRNNLFSSTAFEECKRNARGLEKDTTSQLPKTSAALPKTKLIVVLEWLLIVGLATQLSLLIYTLFFVKSETFDKYVFHISDWAINTPPIVGVLANLLSFALMLSTSGRSVEALFSSNYFFEAIVTTIIGGLFYIVNLALKVVIQPRVENSSS